MGHASFHTELSCCVSVSLWYRDIAASMITGGYLIKHSGRESRSMWMCNVMHKCSLGITIETQEIQDRFSLLHSFSPCYANFPHVGHMYLGAWRKITMREVVVNI